MSDFIHFVSAGTDSMQGDDAQLVAAASACLDRFTERFNACDSAGMDGELHFPHIMLSGAERLEWLEPGQHPANFFDALKATGWNHTRYEAKEPVLVSQDKVHFVVTYSRRNAEDKVLSTHRNLWIVTRRDDERWGIALRSY